MHCLSEVESSFSCMFRLPANSKHEKRVLHCLMPTIFAFILLIVCLVLGDLYSPDPNCLHTILISMNGLSEPRKQNLLVQSVMFYTAALIFFLILIVFAGVRNMPGRASNAAENGCCKVLRSMCFLLCFYTEKDQHIDMFWMLEGGGGAPIPWHM